MKLKQLCIYAICLATLLLQGQVSYGQVAVRTTYDSYDFGKIKEVDGVVKCTFTVVNRSKNPVVIQRVQTSCGCTTSSFSKAPIKSGAKRDLEVVFDPTNRPGKFMKVIYIYISGMRNPLQVSIKGLVEGRPRTVEDNFPFEWGTMLRATSQDIISLRNIERSKQKYSVVDLYNCSDKALNIKYTVNNEYVNISFKPEILNKGDRGQMIIKMNFAGADLYGPQSAVVEVNAGGEVSKLFVTANVVDNFSLMSPEQKENAPVSEYSAVFHHFNDVKTSSLQTVEITLTNKGHDDLIVRDVSSSSGALQFSIDKMTIKRGAVSTIRLTLDVGDVPGRVNESVMVTTNDPNRPVRELRVMAVAK